MSQGWDCEAYGAGGAVVGALCFIAGELGERVCADPGACAAAMGAERVRVYGAITEQAAAGDPVAVYLAGEFTSPDQLLNNEHDRGLPPR